MRLLPQDVYGGAGGSNVLLREMQSGGASTEKTTNTAAAGVGYGAYHSARPGRKRMSVYTIEIWSKNQTKTIMTFQGLLGQAWEGQAWSRWVFTRGGKQFVVLGMNEAADRELSSVAVDLFLRPLTDRECIDLRRLEILPRSTKRAQK